MALKKAPVLVDSNIHPAGELFFQPAELVDVSLDALIFNEDTFGPVAGSARFASKEEMVTRANDTEYGLVSYVHTSNAQRTCRLTRALPFGMVAVNRTKVTGARFHLVAGSNPVSAVRVRDGG